MTSSDAMSEQLVAELDALEALLRELPFFGQVRVGDNDWMKTGAVNPLGTRAADVIASLRARLAVPVDIPPGLLDTLRRQRQVDEDGTECGVNREAVDSAIALLESLSRSRDEYKALAERGKADAERYAWLREDAVAIGALHTYVEVDGVRKYADVWYSMETLDAAIDAARAAIGDAGHG